MATVWAAREDAFTWKNDPTKTGWSHAFAFSSLSGLADQMIRVVPALTGAVTKLAIVAHGDERGHVQLDRLLTPESATSFRQDFMQLDAFLGPYARLIFFSCIAGKDAPGSALLNTISGKFLPRRHVIGFEVFGGVGPGGARMLAGNINAVDRPGQAGGALAAGPGSSSTILTEYSWYSKWSFDGQIIRLPRNQQGAPTYQERKVYGIKAVSEAIRKHLAFIKYVYFESDAVHAKVPAADLSLVRGKVANKTRAELTVLAGTSKHEGAVAAWADMLLRYQCADPQCPGHQNPWDLCPNFVGRFPNGPLQ
jgi:hypothetical protein